MSKLDRMFEQACAFSDCAKCCEVDNNKIIEHRFKSHTVAGIVNSAFSCEVFIKTLLTYHDISTDTMRKTGGHDLKKLWKLFKYKDEDTAQDIENRMQKIFNLENESKFDELLDIISNAFQYWRYIYEKDSCKFNINFLRFFRILLREKCCNKLYNKTWEEYINKY